MRNIRILYIVIFVAIGASGSSDFNKMQEFYYNQGYKAAAKEYYEKGIADYKNYVFKNVLPQYEAKFKSIEATKYLLSNGYITYPESYRIATKTGEYKIVFTEPKIEEPIKIEDLFRIPIKSSSKDFESFDDEETNISNNGLNVINDSSSSIVIPESVSQSKQATTLNIPKNKEYLSIINKHDLRYLEGYESYTIYFNNQTEKAEFCFQINGDSTCKNF